MLKVYIFAVLWSICSNMVTSVTACTLHVCTFHYLFKLGGYFYLSMTIDDSDFYPYKSLKTPWRSLYSILCVDPLKILPHPVSLSSGRTSGSAAGHPGPEEKKTFCCASHQCTSSGRISGLVPGCPARWPCFFCSLPSKRRISGPWPGCLARCRTI